MLIQYVHYNKDVDDCDIKERFLEFKVFYMLKEREIAGAIWTVLMDQ